MRNLIVRLNKKSGNEAEFDFTHPMTGKRVRRKVSSNAYCIEKAAVVLDGILEDARLIKERRESRRFGCDDGSQDWLGYEEEPVTETLEELDARIRRDNVFVDYADEIVKILNTVYFNYYPEVTYSDQETVTAEVLGGIFTDPVDLNVVFLGKAGVGKSSIINKMSYFSDKGELINFPFVDTSRTTVYAAEYLLVPAKEKYRCAVVFLSGDIIRIKVDECIERAIYKAIEIQLEPESGSIESEQDRIVCAFYTDPSQQFDMRLCFGKHIKATSKNYDKPENAAASKLWASIAMSCAEIAKAIVGMSASSDSGTLFYQEKYTKIVKSADAAEPVFAAYDALRCSIVKMLRNTTARIFKDVESNKAVTDFSLGANYFQCNVTYRTIGDFSDFISRFTSKSIHAFGNSLFPLVHKLKIEIPYSKSVAAHIRDEKRICCYDTVGVAHTTESGGGFERSTSLNMESADAVIIVDDSTLNMDNNTGVILRHMASRVDSRKIYFALAFYDDFNKEQFDQDEDLEEQKTAYLSSIQQERVAEFLEGNEDSKRLNARHLSGRNTFYLKGLARHAEPDYGAINGMLDTIREEVDISRSPLGVGKKDVNKPIVKYDYRKVSLHYTLARGKFLSGQENIYMNDIPHFKTTEALMRRLGAKIPYFNGAKKLIPVDDFFDALVRELSEFISKPEGINFTYASPDSKKQIIARIRTVATEKIRSLIHTRFFAPNMLNTWVLLYFDGGAGVDARRRKGFLEAEEQIAQGEQEFLAQDKRQHMIDELEDIFKASIDQVEKEFFPVSKKS